VITWPAMLFQNSRNLLVKVPSNWLESENFPDTANALSLV